MKRLNNFLLFWQRPRVHGLQDSAQGEDRVGLQSIQKGKRQTNAFTRGERLSFSVTKKLTTELILCVVSRVVFLQSALNRKKVVGEIGVLQKLRHPNLVSNKESFKYVTQNRERRVRILAGAGSRGPGDDGGAAHGGGAGQRRRASGEAGCQRPLHGDRRCRRTPADPPRSAGNKASEKRIVLDLRSSVTSRSCHTTRVDDRGQVVALSLITVRTGPRSSRSNNTRKYK